LFFLIAAKRAFSLFYLFRRFRLASRLAIFSFAAADAFADTPFLRFQAFIAPAIEITFTLAFSLIFADEFSLIRQITPLIITSFELPFSSG
jgi:hypothetical protein